VVPAPFFLALSGRQLDVVSLGVIGEDFANQAAVGNLTLKGETLKDFYPLERNDNTGGDALLLQGNCGVDGRTTVWHCGQWLTEHDNAGEGFPNSKALFFDIPQEIRVFHRLQSFPQETRFN